MRTRTKFFVVPPGYAADAVPEAVYINPAHVRREP
jgi:hypothetical protein